jgi:hypothetical protein
MSRNNMPSFVGNKTLKVIIPHLNIKTNPARTCSGRVVPHKEKAKELVESPN